MTAHNQLPLFAPQDRVDPWIVRVSMRARRLAVRIYPGGKVEIVVPPRVSPTIVQRFIAQHRQWIDRRVRECGATAAPVLPRTISLPAFGRAYSVDYLPGSGQARLIANGDTALLVHGQTDNQRAVTGVLERWLRKFAFAEFEPWMRRLCQETGLDCGKVSIRRQRTRWGSCSSSGTISLNVCLAFLEPQVVRYLLVHELCHTRHMNHSARFWALVERHEPDYRRLNRILTSGWRQVPAWILL